MDEASAKKAEELFYKTFNMLKNGPSQDISPELKKKMTPNSLFWMSFCGVSYTVIVTCVIFIASWFVTTPVIYEHEPSALLREQCILIYLLFGIVANFILVISKRSIYSGGYKDLVTDIDSTFCLDCQHGLPPRVHHCVLCRCCIVKRDHHCFFTGCCVGFDNQRYFVVFCGYCFFACAYCLKLSWQYLVITHGHPSEYGYYHIVLPLVILEWIFGYASWMYLKAVALLALCFLSAFGSGCAFGWQFFMAIYGKTTHEFQKSGGLAKVNFLKIQYRRNLFAVFGPCWFLNFLFPMVCFKQLGSGFDTDESKVM